MDRWEAIKTNHEASTVDRLKVPGGWIYKLVDNVEDEDWKMAAVFVPEPKEE